MDSVIRIAFIMLCHTEVEHINRLIKKLEEFQSADVYIHVDLNHPEIRKQISNSERVYILPEGKAFHIIWGGINIVKATLQMIREVQQSGKGYDYIWLISGQDYPIVPANEIERRLEAHPGFNYIDMIQPDNDHYSWYKKLYEVWYPAWINKDTITVKAFKRIYKIATGGYRHTFKQFIKRKPFEEKLAFGSQWWVLTSEAAFELLDYSDKHPEVLEYYRNAIIPDESFFQTLFMIGAYRENRKSSLTFSYLDSNHRHPVTLTEKDYEKVKKAREQKCFARKFDDRSQRLIQLIEENGG